MGEKLTGRPVRRIPWIFALLSPLILIAACAAEPELTTVQESKIVGAWSEGSGTQITFRADRTFDASKLNIGSRLYDGCPSGAASGSWAFFVDEGEPGGSVFASEEATSGESLVLTFQEVPQGDCVITLNAVDGGKALCASDDPDFSCPLNIKFTKIKGVKN
ncbi:hypothetical protein ABCR94_31630 [Streptomyces sp. 21So2-11]|uniref:hypothetical protein n=1 Tax=Streptomyces sp. 21So2-11 TaxID=3144408 RepID=UPI00321BB18B